MGNGKERLAMTVRLETATGDLVAEHQIPPFKTRPDIIIFGIRTFVFDDLNDQHIWSADGPIKTIYREAVAYAIPDQKASKNVR